MSTRRHARRVLGLAIALGVLVPSDSAAQTRATTGTRPTKQYTIEQFINTTSVAGASFSSDETRILFSSNKTGIWNAYVSPVAGGDWTPITQSTTDSTYAVSFFPGDDRILFTKDQGGNELNHLYVLEPAGGGKAYGEPRDLTPGEKLKAMFAGWMPDGSAFYVRTNERDNRFFDVYRYDAKTYERTIFYKNEAGYIPASISNDGTMDGADQAEHDQRQRHLPLEQGDRRHHASHAAPGTGQLSAPPRSIRPRATCITSPTTAASSRACGATRSPAGPTRTCRRPSGTSSTPTSRTRARIRVTGHQRGRPHRDQHRRGGDRQAGRACPRSRTAASPA